MLSGVGFAILCVVVPCVIGAGMYGALEAWDALRRRVAADGEGLPQVDYSI